MVRRSVLWLGVVCLAAAGQTPEFTKDILPVLSRYCGQCHSGAQAMGKLDLRSVDTMLKGGDHGPALVKGAAAKSLLYTRIADRTMPMGDKKVSAEDAKLIREWIDAGAPAASMAAKSEAKPAASHWAFIAPKRPAVPAVQNTGWVRTPVDAFVLARLNEKGIKPVAAADKLTLLRRVYLDLIGLPPTPAEQQAFVADKSAEAYDRVVERLLSSPQYGERWARHWLDVVRYAESNGYERDGTKPHAWRYRDWVIDSLNRDKGYDRFLTEQLAGDEVEGSNAETQIATTFLRLGTWDDEPAEPMLDRYDQLDDILGTTAATFLGVTLRCARCHDHKFEPFSQKDYYRTLAIFQPLKRPQDDRKDLDRLVGTEAELSAYNKAKEKADSQVGELKGQIEKVRREVMKRLFSAEGKAKRQDGKLAWVDHAETVLAFATPVNQRSKEQKKLVEAFNEKLDGLILDEAASAERDKLAECKREIARIDAARMPEPPRGYIWYEEGSQAPATRLLVRGDPSRPGEEVEPGVPTILGKPDAAIKATSRSTGRRLWFARWLTSAENPLTARVMVNRVWQWHFGDGLVGTENDFGVIGQRPTHPELLDWLATEFRESGWSLKGLHRVIVKSNTYQLSAGWDEAAGKKDPEASLLWRWRPRRLEAEVVRDVTLALSGELNPQMRGPSIYPDLPQAVLDGQSKPGDGWGKSAHDQSSRRSVYIFAKRSLAVPELEVLDAPDTTSSCEQRSVSTTGPQALTFLNGEFTRARAKRFAARLAEASGDTRAQAARAFELALSRPATAQELAAATVFLDRQKARIASELTAAGKDSGEASRRALESFAVTMLNANEFFYVN